jgi:hypothetical protein
MIHVEFVATPGDVRAFQQFAVTKVRGFTSRASLGFSWRPVALGVPVGIILVFLDRTSTFEFHAPTALVCAAIFVGFWSFFRRRFSRALPPAAEGALLGPRRTTVDEGGIREKSAHSESYKDWRGLNRSTGTRSVSSAFIQFQFVAIGGGDSVAVNTLCASKSPQLAELPRDRAR